jgi:hypothetical protein
MVRLRALWHRHEHVRLCVTRDAIEQTLITHDCESPRLLIYGAWRKYRGVDKVTDRMLVDALCGIFSHRAAARNRLVDIHFAVLPLKLRLYNLENT